MRNVWRRLRVSRQNSMKTWWAGFSPKKNSSPISGNTMRILNCCRKRLPSGTKSWRNRLPYRARREFPMNCTEAYKEHIMYTFHGFCKVVIHNAAITAWRDQHRRHKREISLEYLTVKDFLIIFTKNLHFRAKK